MGKRIIQQRRGRGTSQYVNHNQRGAGVSSFNLFERGEATSAEVIDLVHSKSHSAPLMKIRYDNGNTALLPAFEGCYVGKSFTVDHRDEVSKEEIVVGNAYMLKNIPEGTSIYAVESTPGDSSTLIKAGGSYGRVVAHNKGQTKIVLPSKKEKILNGKCRAIVGEISGSGRLEKPFLKAGLKKMHMQKTNKLWPKVSGVAMSAFDHPHGSTRSLRKGRPTIAPNNAPPGRKVGMLRPRHTGRNR
ncbi:MAG: 50S ribosomal protein L2 [Nanoarchaeota archaeon]|nr:50S ribosomal protein L2 [Nanoarchaeota archaeon]MEC8339159.1 50S ribosomal protein L2 [Nanoarchaeota archaeon]